MPIVYVYNPQTNWNEKYYRGLSEPMPYVMGRTMTVGEFRGESRSNILWTDKRMLNAWNTFRNGWGRPIFIGYAFKRIWEGGHTGQSQHYAGVALDFGHTLTAAQRTALWRYAYYSGVWTYVEPQNLTPRWIHVDKRHGVPACSVGGYPSLAIGSRGVYVFVLQDALDTLGFTGGGLDGQFGVGTRNAVYGFQNRQGLPITGVVNCVTWQRLTSLANGKGRTSEIIQYNL